MVLILEITEILGFRLSTRTRNSDDVKRKDRGTISEETHKFRQWIKEVQDDTFTDTTGLNLDI